MRKLINNILVPVEIGGESEIAIEKGIQLANHFQCVLHILFIENTSFVPLTAEGHLFGSVSSSEKTGNRQRLVLMEEKYKPLLQAGLHLNMCKGNTEQMVVEYSVLNNVDFIVIGKSKRTILGNLFPSLKVNRLARKTNSAVLTVRSKPSFEHLRNIVLPVGAQLPVRKIMFASYLAKTFNSKIHLISLIKRYPGSSVENSLYLYKTYQLLRDNTNLSIECHTVPGENIADTTLEYAQQINADLIVVNPGRELLLSGFINRLFSRFITNESRIPVMTISATRV